MTRPRRKLTAVSRWNVYADDGSICGVIDHDATPGTSKPFVARSPDVAVADAAYRTIWAASRALRAKHARKVAV